MNNELLELNEIKPTEIQGNGELGFSEEINFDLYLKELSF